MAHTTVGKWLLGSFQQCMNVLSHEKVRHIRKTYYDSGGEDKQHLQHNFLEVFPIHVNSSLIIPVNLDGL